MIKLPEKLEYQVIVDLVRPGSSVLDLGCGDGYLMDLLATRRMAKVQGIEIDERAIYQCVAKGLSVLWSETVGARKYCSPRSWQPLLASTSRS